jgi:hypothetical protein
MRYRLIWAVLLWVDERICNLPTPSHNHGREFTEWAVLGDVHAAIDRAYAEKLAA